MEGSGSVELGRKRGAGERKARKAYSKTKGRIQTKPAGLAREGQSLSHTCPITLSHPERGQWLSLGLSLRALGQSRAEERAHVLQ